MAIRLRSVSFAWIVGASSGFAGIGGYLIYDFINPTGNQWLLSSGYIFNPPKLTNYKSQNNYCSENIFKQDPNFDDNKVYGCRVASLDIWNSGDKSTSQPTQTDYLFFVDRLVIRKGGQGWEIISLINGREGPIRYIQMTIYEFKNNRWNSQQPVTGAIQLTNIANEQTTSVNCKQNPPNIQIQEISSKNKYLQIRFEDEIWYSPNGNSGPESSRVTVASDPSQEEPSEIWKKQKSGSWIWVENKKSSWTILGGLDFAFKKIADFKRPLYMLTSCSQTYFPGSQELKWLSRKAIQDAQNETIDKFPKGKWVDTQEFCNYSYKRKVDEDKLKKLKLFCAKPITNLYISKPSLT